MKSRTRFSKKKRGIQCLNCGQPLWQKDNFCSNCGQVNDELPLSIKQFIEDFFSGFFSFDSRFFKTFGPLLFKPGKVPKDYVEGKRMRYVNPFQLYLHVTIVFFLLQGIFSAIDEYQLTGSFTDDPKTEITKDSISQKVNQDLKNVEKELSEQGIEVDLSNATKNDTVKEKSGVMKMYDKYIRKYRKDTLISNHILKTKNHLDSLLTNKIIIAQLKDTSFTIHQKDSIFNRFFATNMDFISGLTNSNDVKNWEQIESLSLLKEFSANYTKEVFSAKNITYELPEEANISVEDGIIKEVVGQTAFKKVSDFMAYIKEHEEADALTAIDDLGYERSRWNVFYFKKAQDINRLKEDPEFRKAYGDDIISKTSVALFFLLPVFTAFLALLYIRGKHNYTEHLVFVFNVQTVFFLLLIFFTIFNRVLKTDAGIGIFILAFLFYLYKALRNFYKQNRFKTIVKFVILNFIYFMLALVGIVIVSFIAFVF